MEPQYNIKKLFDTTEPSIPKITQKANLHT